MKAKTSALLAVTGGQGPDKSANAGCTPERSKEIIELTGKYYAATHVGTCTQRVILQPYTVDTAMVVPVKAVQLNLQVHTKQHSKIANCCLQMQLASWHTITL